MSARVLLSGSFILLALLAEGGIAVSGLRRANSVTVLARGPAGLRIEGKGTEVSVERDASALLFKVRLSPLETGIALRDVQLRQLLEADKYPTAVLRVPRSGLTFPQGGERVEGTADGDLMLHGQSRPVKVHYRAERAASGTAKVHGSFQLDVRDFDIEAPSWLGLPLAPRVEVTAELALNDA